MCQDCEDKPAMMSKPSFDDQFNAIMKDKGVDVDVGTVIKERDALKQRVDDLLVEVATAKADEREACAKLADDEMVYSGKKADEGRDVVPWVARRSCAREIAIDIRARGAR